MTVVVVAEDSVTCDWSVRGDVKSKLFPGTALKKAVSEETAKDARRAVLFDDLAKRLGGGADST